MESFAVVHTETSLTLRYQAVAASLIRHLSGTCHNSKLLLGYEA
jgi:hypothetical protein